MNKNCYFVLFLDDQIESVHIVKDFVGQFPFLKEMYSTTDIYSAKKYMDQHPIDILFLDIEMPELNGFDFLKLFPKPPVVIICSAHPNYGYESSLFQVAGYIPKLPGYVHFKQVIENAIDMVDRREALRKNESESIVIKAYPGKRLVQVQLHLLKYAEIQDKQLFLFLEDEILETVMTMDHLKTLLPDNQFAQISRSYLISKNYIEIMTDKFVKMKGNIQITISAHYLENLNRILRIPFHH